MKFVAVILLQKSADRSKTFTPSPAHLVSGGSAITLLIYEKQCHFDKKQTVLTHCDWWGSKIPPPKNLSTEIQLCFFLPAFTENPPLFSVSRRHWKKPNVCLLSPILTSSLPPLSPSAPPILAVARSDLHPAVQRQPQRPQPHQLPQLLPWGLLPSADRIDQRDSEPGSQWPVAVLCQGPGVLYSGPEGKSLISF